MAKQKYIKEPTTKPVVGLETETPEVITPNDIGAVEDLGFVDGGVATVGDTTTLVDTEQLDALENTDATITPVVIDPTNVPEQDKVSSVAQVMDRAQNDPRVDTTVSPAEETNTSDVETIATPIDTTTDISAIIKRGDLSLLEKIELISTTLGGVAGSVINSLRALYILGSKTATRLADPMNREQRALVRYFIRLATQSNPEEFNYAMKYINWVYKQLTDEKVLDKEQMTLVRGVSPLDPTNSSIYTAGKDDKELITFVYLITVIDVKANAKTPIEKSRKIDIGKTTANTLLTEDIVTKINNFYSL